MPYTPKTPLFKRFLQDIGCTTEELQEAFALESQHLSRDDMLALQAWLDTGKPKPRTAEQERVLTRMLTRAAAKRVKQQWQKNPLEAATGRS